MLRSRWQHEAPQHSDLIAYPKTTTPMTTTRKTIIIVSGILFYVKNVTYSQLFSITQANNCLVFNSTEIFTIIGVDVFPFLDSVWPQTIKYKIIVSIYVLFNGRTFLRWTPYLGSHRKLGSEIPGTLWVSLKISSMFPSLTGIWHLLGVDGSNIVQKLWICPYA